MKMSPRYFMQISFWSFLILAVLSLPSISYIYAETDSIKIKEWEIPTTNSAPHDIVVGTNGMIWFTEINTNKIGMFNPNTEEFHEYDIPTPSSRPHGLVSDIQGNVWFAEVGAGKIGKLDPLTGIIEEFSTPTTNSGPHTPIFADDTTLWFTEQNASQIGKLDVSTGKIIEFKTITKSANPYGIITDDQGNAWFAELRGHHVGKVDEKTGEVTEYPMISENSGPRRIAIDSNGILWVTLYNSGKIASLDPVTKEVEEFSTSSESSGPYAIWVDPFDNVWFSMTGIYKMGKFDQSTQKIQEYELPSPQTHIKFIHSDSVGNIWFPNYNNNKIGVIQTGTTSMEPKTDTKMMEENQNNNMDIPSNPEIAYFPAPLKQIQDGVKPQSVTCTEGLELVLKFSNGNPACVKPNSVSKLIQRGWAIHILSDYEKNENNNSEIFEVGAFQVDIMDVNYFQNAKGYLAKPSENGVYPAVVMIHEWWGLNENIKEMAGKLASHGYVVLAVDLYDGKVGTTSEEARQLRSSFEQSQWTDNMNTAVNYLEEQYNPSSIGSIGWCFGGGQSLNLALNNDDLDATVMYYGSLTLEKDQLSSINWPILGIFAGLDSGIPPESVNQFETVLNELEIENEIYIYPEVNHAFANPSGDRHAPEESKDAWEKTLNFLEQHLS